MNTNTAKAQLRKAFAGFFLTPTLKAVDGEIAIGKHYIAIAFENRYLIVSADAERKTIARGNIDDIARDMCHVCKGGLGSWIHTNLDKCIDTDNIKKLIKDGMIDEKKTARLIYKWKIKSMMEIENKSKAALRAVLS